MCARPKGSGTGGRGPAANGKVKANGKAVKETVVVATPPAPATQSKIENPKSKIIKRPKLAVWKFSSCDGCQLSLLDVEESLLAVTNAIELAYFPEATRAEVKGPYDVSLVEGSITTPHDAERIHEIRRQSKVLVSIGACATAGGIQALRNFTKVNDLIPMVYANPAYISTLNKSTPISDHVKVDFELRGCPVNKYQLVEVVSALLAGRKPVTPPISVCMECKRKGNVCGLVAFGAPCMGPVTHAGCNALCPSYGRACFGCFGPKETPNTASLSEWFGKLGLGDVDIIRLFRTFNAYAEPFRLESEAHERR